MKVSPTQLPDVLLIESSIHTDERGYFTETFNRRTFSSATGLDINFAQDNLSCSRRGVLRGLHYQLPPHPQGKLVRVVSGRVYDVAVDIRRTSSHFGRWIGVELSADDGRSLWIPPGFAHGFIALENNTMFLYKTTDFYDKQSERSIIWNDPDLAIAWPHELVPRVSSRDLVATKFSAAEVFP